MSVVTPLRNRHPADELADVRADIKQLKAREDELRQVLIADNASLVGAEWEADIKLHSYETVRSKAAIQTLGRELLTPFITRAHGRAGVAGPAPGWPEKGAKMTDTVVPANSVAY